MELLLTAFILNIILVFGIGVYAIHTRHRLDIIQKAHAEMIKEITNSIDRIYDHLKILQRRA